MPVVTRICVGISALALSAAAGAAVTAVAVPAETPAANAATPGCGTGCTALYPAEVGSADVAAAQPGRVQAGHDVILHKAGPYATEDFRLTYEGPVSVFYSNGIVGPAVGKTWPAEPVYEYQYDPDGVETQLCLGVGQTAGNGTPITLQQCGVSSKTLWIALTIDRLPAGVPLVNGSDTVTATPYVLTASKVGQMLSTSELFLTGGTFSPTEMWKDTSGVL